MQGTAIASRCKPRGHQQYRRGGRRTGLARGAVRPRHEEADGARGSAGDAADGLASPGAGARDQRWRTDRRPRRQCRGRHERFRDEVGLKRAARAQTKRAPHTARLFSGCCWRLRQPPSSSRSCWRHRRHARSPRWRRSHWLQPFRRLAWRLWPCCRRRCWRRRWPT